MSIKIGNLTYDNDLFMAPMEGITDVPFRRIVRKFGCAVTCTQMIHAEAVLHGTSERLRDTLAIDPAEKPVGIQLCGSDAHTIAEAAQRVEQMGFAFVDINMGCPAKNVVNNGAGSALLQDPPKTGDIVRELKKRLTVPITVKVRAGWDDSYKAGLEVAKIVEQEGASLVTIHARTRSQKFKGHADWNLIQELKGMVKIPVVGNGDVFEPDDIDTMRRETTADGVMVARGALGNPWIFSQMFPTVRQVRDTILEHMGYHMDFYTRKDRALITFRKHVAWYTKGLPHSSEFRVSVFKQPSYEVFLQMFNDYFATLDPDLIIKFGRDDEPEEPVAS